MKRYWAYVTEAKIAALMAALVKANVARFEVADNRGGNGQMIVVVNIYDRVGAQFKHLPDVDGGWKGGKE